MGYWLSKMSWVGGERPIVEPFHNITKQGKNKHPLDVSLPQIDLNHSFKHRLIRTVLAGLSRDLETLTMMHIVTYQSICLKN